MGVFENFVVDKDVLDFWSRDSNFSKVSLLYQILARNPLLLLLGYHSWKNMRVRDNFPNHLSWFTSGTWKIKVSYCYLRQRRFSSGLEIGKSVDVDWAAWKIFFKVAVGIRGKRGL